MIHNFFLEIVLILIAARILGELAAKLGIPSVIGEMSAGILLGPSILGWVPYTTFLKLLAEIGIVLLLFEVGLETDISKLLGAGTKGTITAITGVVVPLALGYGLSMYVFNLEELTSLLIGCTLTATSIGITLRVLGELKKQKTPEAQIVLAAAIIDDIIGIVLLSMLYEFANSGSIAFGSTFKIISFVAVFFATAPFLTKLASGILQKFEKTSEIPGMLPSMVIAIILFFSWCASIVGAPPLLGGFAAGLALSRHFFWEIPLVQHNEKFSRRIENELKPIVHVFAPIFFVAVGVALNLREIAWCSPFVWSFSLALLAIAILGKICSGIFLIGDSWKSRLGIGIAMIPRGEVGLIFAEVGKNKELFNVELYAGVIIVIALTTIFAPLAMKKFFQSKSSA